WRAEGDGGAAYDAQARLRCFGIADRVEPLGAGVCPWVSAVDTVHPVLAHQDDVALDLEGALGGAGLVGEVRQTEAGTEDDDAPLLEVPDGAKRDVRLGDLAHRD